MQHRAGLVAVLGEGGAQGVVALLQGGEAGQQRVAVQAAFQAQGGGNVVGGALRVQLPENPLALLGVGQHGRCICRECLELRLPDAACLAGANGEGGQLGGLEQARQGQFDSELLAHPRDHLGDQQGMPAQFEEVVAPPYPLDLQDLGPDGRQLGFQALGRGLEIALPVAGLEARQGLAVQLAVGGQRQALQQQPLQRHHVFRQLRLEGVLQALAQGGRLLAGVVRHHVGHQGLAGGAFLHQHHGLAGAVQVTQAGLDLAQFDAEAAHLHLGVDPADVFQQAVRPTARQVAGAVQARPRLAEGIGDEHRSGALWVAQIATADAGAGHIQLAHGAGGHRQQAAVQHVEAVVVGG
ncbi:hypothetical protein D3C78_359170 [compost metagenome]